MRKFRVSVNGSTYEVEVEEIGAQIPVAVPAPVQAAAPAPKPAQPAAQPTPKPAPQAASKGGSVTAPMPGTVLAVKVNVGDKVSPNTVVAILEAMKMENEIFAGRSGVIAQILTSKGASVNTGDALVLIDPQ